MALKMLGMNVLVKVVKQETSKGGIVLTTSARKGPLNEAVVVRVGPGETQFGSFVKIDDVAEGDTVIIDESYAKPIKYNGEECFVVLYKDIVGVDKEAAAQAAE